MLQLKSEAAYKKLTICYQFATSLLPKATSLLPKATSLLPTMLPPCYPLLIGSMIVLFAPKCSNRLMNCPKIILRGTKKAENQSFYQIMKKLAIDQIQSLSELQQITRQIKRFNVKEFIKVQALQFLQYLNLKENKMIKQTVLLALLHVVNSQESPQEPTTCEIGKDDPCKTVDFGTYDSAGKETVTKATCCGQANLAKNGVKISLDKICVKPFEGTLDGVAVGASCGAKAADHANMLSYGAAALAAASTYLI